MSDATAKELGLEALAAGFEWAPGCLDGSDAVRLLVDDCGHWVYFEYCGQDDWHADHAVNCLYRMWPDFRDPATLGVLLAQVRAALADGDTHAERLFTGEWAVFNQHGNLVSDKGPTEAHALVAALQAAKEV